MTAKPTEWITNRRRAQARLPRLASWLRQVSEHVNGARFHLDTFADYRGDVPPRNVQEAEQCGFKGCALGWATLEPGLRKAGLRVEAYQGEAGFADFSESLNRAAFFFGVTDDAAECIFGVSWTDWRHAQPVTGPLDPHDPIQAAERIERFCHDNGISLP